MTFLFLHDHVRATAAVMAISTASACLRETCRLTVGSVPAHSQTQTPQTPNIPMKVTHLLLCAGLVFGACAHKENNTTTNNTGGTTETKSSTTSHKKKSTTHHKT